MIIDDYAHHPEEIKTTLNALRLITKKKLITVFEPHRYTRIKEMREEFINSFQNADVIFILPVYGAGEKLIKKINNSELSKLFKNKYKNKQIKPVDKTKALYLEIKQIISNRDNVIFMGAGNSSKIANSIKELMEKNE